VGKALHHNDLDEDYPCSSHAHGCRIDERRDKSLAEYSDRMINRAAYSQKGLFRRNWKHFRV
jgi:hypothetical protein